VARILLPGESYLAVLDALYDARDSIRPSSRARTAAPRQAEAWAKSPGARGLLRHARHGATNRFDRRAHRAADPRR